MSVYRRNHKQCRHPKCERRECFLGWGVLVDLERNVSGSRKRKYIGTFPTKKEADAAERRALEERDRGTDLAPEKVTVDELVKRYIRDCVARNVEPKTVERYEGLASNNITPHIGTLLVAKLRPTHLSDLYATLLERGRVLRKRTDPESLRRGLSPKTVKHVHSLLNAALKWGLRLNLCTHNVADAAEPPHAARGEAKALSQDEVARTLAIASGTSLGPLVTLAFATGARRGELLALRWNAVDLEAATMVIRASLSETRKGGVRLKPPKTDRVRTVALSQLAIDAFRRQRVAQAQERLRAGAAYVDVGFVFADAIGRPLKPSLVSAAFARIAKQAGISTTRLHDARHTAASWLIADGVDIRTVGAVLGHSAASTTLNIYSHAIAGAQPAAVAKLGERLRRAAAVDDGKGR